MCAIMSSMRATTTKSPDSPEGLSELKKYVATSLLPKFFARFSREQCDPLIDDEKTGPSGAEENVCMLKYPHRPSKSQLTFFQPKKRVDVQLVFFSSLFFASPKNQVENPIECAV